MMNRRIFVACLAVLMTAVSAAAGDRPQGLLWNRSGLAATLPLQVMTDAGGDYLLHLRNPETGQPVLAAYVRGGVFFRVLVPPGRYALAFWTGTGWKDETLLFGPGTRHFVIEQPLTFKATVARKHGHLVDLRSDTEAAVRGFSICQRFALDPRSLRSDAELEFEPPRDLQDTRRVPDRFTVPRFDLRTKVCD